MCRLEEGEGSAHRYCMNVCTLGFKRKGRTWSEMKVERNKRFRFNLVERRREGFPCAHWLKASRSVRKDCDKSPVRKSNGTVHCDNARPDVNLTHFRQKSRAFLPAAKGVNLISVLFFSVLKCSSLKMEQIKSNPQQ